MTDELIQSYYSLKNIVVHNTNNESINLNKLINDELLKIKDKSCNTPFDSNLKGLVLQLAGQELNKISPKTGFNYIKESIKEFTNAIDLRKTQYDSLDIYESYLNLANSRNLLYSSDDKINATSEARLSKTDYLEASKTLNPELKERVNISLSYMYSVLEEFKLGIDSATKAIVFFEKNKNKREFLINAYNNRGINLLFQAKQEKSSFDDARADFQEALKIDSKSKSSKTNLFNLEIEEINQFVEKGNIIEAEKRIEKIKVFLGEQSNISNQNTLATIFNNLATKYYERGNYDESLNYVKEALSLNPKFFPAIIIETMIKKNTDRLDDDAVKNLSLIPEDDPTYSTSQNLLGTIFFSKGEYEKAKTYLDSAVKAEDKKEKIDVFKRNLFICNEEIKLNISH